MQMSQEKITDVRAGYDLVADEYARRIYGELAHKPFDRSLLDRFAESVRGRGVVCDLGCGPGQVARYLYERGAEACGMDLSAGMIECARRLNPGIEFHTGDMRALPAPDNCWAGITAFYAIVNLSPDDVARALGEMLRVLAPEGRLLMAFHIGDDTSQVEDLWDSGAALEFHMFRIPTIADLIRGAGFEIDEVVERQPYAPDVEYQSRRSYIFAHKSTAKTT